MPRSAAARCCASEAACAPPRALLRLRLLPCLRLGLLPRARLRLLDELRPPGAVVSGRTPHRRRVSSPASPAAVARSAPPRAPWRADGRRASRSRPPAEQLERHQAGSASRRRGDHRARRCASASSRRCASRIRLLLRPYCSPRRRAGDRGGIVAREGAYGAAALLRAEDRHELLRLLHASPARPTLTPR